MNASNRPLLIMTSATFLLAVSATASAFPLRLALRQAAPSQPLRGFMLAPRFNGSGDDVLEDINRLADLGATLVRLPMYFRTGLPVEWYLDAAEACRQRTSARGVTLVIDFHDAPGGGAGSLIPNQDLFQKTWVRFAKRFKGHPGVWFELINEPYLSYGGRPWSDLAAATARKIRDVDPSRTIVVGAPKDKLEIFEKWVPPRLTNIIVTAHAWDWFQHKARMNVADSTPYPYKGAYPTAVLAPVRGERTLTWNLRDIRRRLRWAVQFRAKYGVPVYIGEVGVQAVNDAGVSNPNAGRFLEDFLRSSRGFHVTVHAFREGPLYDYSDPDLSNPSGTGRRRRPTIWEYEQNPAAWSALTGWLRNSP